MSSGWFLLVDLAPSSEDMLDDLVEIPDLSAPTFQLIVSGPYQSLEDADADSLMYRDDGCQVFWYELRGNSREAL